MNFSDLLITEEATIREAMTALDRSAKKVLFLQQDGKLLAALSDGDIRRWILRGGSLDAPAGSAANYSPKSVDEAGRGKAREYMRRWHIDVLPVLGPGRVITDVISVYDEDAPAPREAEPVDLPVVIMAGGYGTRLYPYTKILPKPLIPIGDLPVTEHIINRFRRCGCRRFYLIVNHKKNMIKAYFNEISKDYELTYVDEDEPLGTGGGVGLLRGRLDSTFVLTNCDTIIDEDFSKIVHQHRESGNAVTMICSVKDLTIPYGVVEVGDQGQIQRMREKPHLSFLINTGSYIVEPSVIGLIEPGRPVGFPDIIQKAMDQGLRVGVFPIGENAWMDMGQFDTLEEMKRRLEGG